MKCLLCNNRGKMDWLTGRYLCEGHRLYNDFQPMPHSEIDGCNWKDYDAHPAKIADTVCNSNSVRKLKRVSMLTHNPFKELME